MQLIEFNESDYEKLYDFMKPIWLKTYDFLPEKQVKLLLDKYFSVKNINRYLDLGYKYYKIDDAGVLVFVAREEEIYIDKLYLTEDARGKGYAEFCFKNLEKFKKDLTLNVNRNNARAVACYLKNGFKVEKEVEIEIGEGLINCDYYMRKIVD